MDAREKIYGNAWESFTRRINLSPSSSTGVVEPALFMGPPRPFSSEIFRLPEQLIEKTGRRVEAIHQVWK